jgi:hypothetical protein
MAKQDIHCPGCKQKLELPAEYIGKSVKCPGCQKVFKATPDAPASAVTATPPPLQEDAEDDRPRKRRDEDEDEDDYDDRPIKKKKRKSSGGGSTYFDQLTQRYRPREPHRGILILLLGGLGFLIPCLAIVLGPMAYYMGGQDLNEMNDGRMDRSGEQMTKVGRILGVISAGLWPILFLGLCCLGLLSGGNNR